MRGADLSSGRVALPVARRHLRAVPRGGRAEVGWRSSPRWRARRRPAGASSASSASTPSPTCRGGAFLLSLRARGLSGVRLVTSDAHEGLVRAVREALPGAAWQRCIAHLERNVLERCRRKGDGSAAVAALKAAFAEADPALVRAGYRRAVELLAAVDARGAELHEDRRPGGARLPRVPAGAPPLGEDQQRLRAHELRDQEAHEGGAGVPVGGVAGEAGRGGVPATGTTRGRASATSSTGGASSRATSASPCPRSPAARRGSSGSSRRRSTGRGGRRRIWGETAAPGNGRTPLFVTRYGLRCITIFSRSKR